MCECVLSLVGPGAWLHLLKKPREAIQYFESRNVAHFVLKWPFSFFSKEEDLRLFLRLNVLRRFAFLDFSFLNGCLPLSISLSFLSHTHSHFVLFSYTPLPPFKILCEKISTYWITIEGTRGLKEGDLRGWQQHLRVEERITIIIIINGEAPKKTSLISQCLNPFKPWPSLTQSRYPQVHEWVCS